MKVKTAAKASLLLAGLVAMPGGRVGGDEAPVARKATLEFGVVATYSGGETHSIGSMGTALQEGGSTTSNLRMSMSAPENGDRCRSNVSMAFGPARTPNGPFPLWEVEGKIRRVTMDDIQVEYAWKRWSGGELESLPDASDRGEAHLSEGGRALLDFVPVHEVSSGCWRNVALELSASIPEDPAFKDRRIGYDVWLVSDDHGKRLTRRLQLIGKQGENVAFDYGMFRSRLPVAAGPDQPADVLETTVTGSIRSRIQPDGSIEILLSAHRELRPGHRHWATAAHGSKHVRAIPGETLRLELPPPAPFAGVDEPEAFQAIAAQHVALVLTPTTVD
jgi:hypothetical protein